MMTEEIPAKEVQPNVRPEKKDDIISRRNSPSARISRFFKATWWIWLIVFMTMWAISDNRVMSALTSTISTLGRFALMMTIAISQFVGIFWFMARTKTEIIIPGDPKTLGFDDYKGQPQLLKLIKQWISLLSDRSKFQKMGGRFVNGLLMYGPPGTGKTMLAKVMAGEAGVAFISIEGSGFKAMFMGVDVLKMMAFIKKARKLAREYGACIAFIDEIDAVGGSRGGVMGGSQNRGGFGGMGGMMGGGTGALTRLLYEMDGVEEVPFKDKMRGRILKLMGKPIPPKDWHVLFMGSTNRPDSLDPALVRPGRFDRMIAVEHPDRTGRRAIIDYYLGKIAHDETVDADAIVADTPGYTPAQIMAAITKDAVRIAIFEDRDKVNQRDIDRAFQEQASGLENPIEDLEFEQKEQIAYHEAGHAVSLYHLFPTKRIVRATIIRRGGSLGHVRYADNVEQYSWSLQEWVKRIMVSLAGDQATKILKGEAWVGTGGDYDNVRNILYRLGASGFFGPPIGDPFVIYKEELKEFWKDSEVKTERLLRQHWAEVEGVAKKLLEDGDLSGKEIVAIIKNNMPENKNGHHPEEAASMVAGAIVEQETPATED